MEGILIAAGITSVANSAMGAAAAATYNQILEIGIAIATTLTSMLGQWLSMVGNWIGLLATWQGTAGGSAVLTAWTTLRDMCNMFFIVLLIAISFATVFSVFPGFKKWSARTALLNVIVAAILINFSLAIGQTITLVGGILTKGVLQIMSVDGKANIGDMLVQTLQPAIILTTNGDWGSLPTVTSANITSGLLAGEKTRYTACLNEEKPAILKGITYAAYSFLASPGSGAGAVGALQATQMKQRKTPLDCQSEIIAARRRVGIAAPQAINAGQGKNFVLMSAIMNLVVIGILFSCLLTVAGFLMIRIIAVWLLLAVAPVAFMSYGIPGGIKSPDAPSLGKWFNLIIGWNLFGPVYLFMLVIGLTFLSGQGNMVAQLIADSGSLAGSWSNMIQWILFYVFALIVFVGGLGVARSSSFAASIKGTQLVGKWAQQFGVFDEKGLAPARLIGRGVSRAAEATGLPDYARAYGTAVKERLQQEGAEFRKGLPSIVQPTSYEEKLARAKSIAGVAGGSKGLLDLRDKQIKTEQGTMEQAMFGMSESAKRNYIYDRIGSKNPTVALAAREMMLKEGILTDPSITDPKQIAINEKWIENTEKMYPVGPAREAFKKRVKEQKDKARTDQKKAKGKPAAEIAEKQKEQKERLDEVATEASAATPKSASDIQGLIQKYTDPTEQKAAQDALAKSNPQLVFEHLKATRIGEPEEDLRLEAFESALRDPKNTVALSDAYLNAGTMEHGELKAAIDSLYPPSATGKEQKKKRDQLRDRMIQQRPSAMSRIKSLFS